MMQYGLKVRDTLRDYARDIGREPSDFINAIADALGQSVWLCNEDFDIVWGSEGTGDILPEGLPCEGTGYAITNTLRDYLKEINLLGGGESVKGMVIENGRELGVTILPIGESKSPMGYIVTVAEGVGARLIGLSERQRKREKQCHQLKLS